MTTLPADDRTPDIPTNPFDGQAFVDRLRRELARLVRTKGCVAVLFLQFGGPARLRQTLDDEIATRIRTRVRDFDLAARWGDDALVLHYPAPDESSAVAVALRVMEEARRPVHVEDGMFTFDVAVGLAVSSKPWTSPAALLVAAAGPLHPLLLAEPSTLPSWEDGIVVIDDSRLRGAEETGPPRSHQRRPDTLLTPFRALTQSEVRVLRGLVGGRSAGQLAAEHHVTIATVRSQIKAILHKLAVNSQLAAVALAREARWMDED